MPGMLACFVWQVKPLKDSTTTSWPLPGSHRLALRDDYVKARLLRARVLKGMGQWSDMLADTEILTAAHDDPRRAWTMHAEALAATGKTEEAASAFRHVISVNPFSSEAYLQLAAVLEAAGDLQGALEACNEAVEQMPQLAEAYQLRGGVKLRLHDKLGAADDLKKALQIKPRSGAKPRRGFLQYGQYEMWRLRNKKQSGRSIDASSGFFLCMVFNIRLFFPVWILQNNFEYLLIESVLKSPKSLAEW